MEGQLRFYAEDVTYFDPITPARIDGWPAVADYFRRAWAGKVNIPRYDMVNPCVLAGPDLAVLSYNLVNYFPGRRWLRNGRNALELNAGLPSSRRSVARHPRTLVIY